MIFNRLELWKPIKKRVFFPLQVLIDSICFSISLNDIKTLTRKIK
jgi:hypothetical protein